MNMTLTDDQMCAECGMACYQNEHHPYAACLMFKGCHDSETVRANLSALSAQPAITEERVIQLARKAGMAPYGGKNSMYLCDAETLVKLAALLAAEGRGK